MGQGEPKSASRRLIPALAALIAGAGLLFGDGESTAWAQAVDVTESTAFDPLALTYGGFLAYPSLEIGAAITDNVRESKTNRISDVGLRLKPELDLYSDWVRHAFRLHAESEHVLYAKESDQNEDNADINAELRLDLRRDFSTTIEGRYILSQEGLAQADIPVNALNPRKDENFAAFGGVTYDPGRISVTLRGGSAWYRSGDVKLSDGSVQNNSDLAYTAPLAQLRLRYQDAPIFVPYVEASYIPRIYDEVDDVLGVKRSSDGLKIAVGAEFAPNALWTGEAAVTYEMRDYYNLALKDVDGVGFDANVVWRPTKISAVKLEANSGIGETNVAGASATRDYTVGLRYDHAFRYNFIGALLGRYTLQDYVGLDLNEQTVAAGLDLTYWLNRRVAVIGGYRFVHYTSTEEYRDYDENRVTIGLRLQP
ncbi:hypothetical protein FHS85_003709 [Rhodoligotrophos appendicifer]|uniref:outer membrane beta-barrel protein n=1 Tax=Rhodoligotrophos appendicifer TaxID=987056 RepID=UPI001184D638|nr:outer membrane beta-barrel protein [Rhodoligotrophos appendicifer]